MLLITRLYIRFWKRRHRSSRFVESRPDIRYHVWCHAMVPGVALRLNCVTYCHIRIKLAATSTTDEPAFLATLIELSVWSRQFRVSNEPKMVSGTKRRSPARTFRLIGYKPPAPELFVPAFAAWPAALRRPAPPATKRLVLLQVAEKIRTHAHQYVQSRIGDTRRNQHAVTASPGRFRGSCPSPPPCGRAIPGRRASLMVTLRARTLGLSTARPARSRAR
jgi:hypothetical protein